MLAAVAAPTNAVADSITFRVQSMAAQKAQIVFYSQDRRHRWPATGRAYDLNDYNAHSFKLNCISNEKICYGAWTTPNQQHTWGSGPGDHGGCSGCCYTCRGNSTQLIVLRNPVRR
jgi:hypothetical protein